MESFIAGIVEQMFANLLFTPIGFAYMWFRYRNKVQMKAALAKEYENSYANAGSVVGLNTVAAVLIILILGLIAVAPLLHWLRS